MKAVRGKPASNQATPKAVVRQPQAYVLTARERELSDAFLARRKRQLPPVKFAVNSSGKATQVSVDHPDQAVGCMITMSSLGTENAHFVDGLLNQIINISGRGQDVDASKLTQIFALVQGIGPTNETEAMLATQMAAIHNATMMAARRLNYVDNVEQQDSASNMLNKLARTFAIQVETLKKYRSTGEQNILVQHQHVTVNEGGQAIVGNISPGGGATNKKEHQPHEPSGTHEPSTPMLGNEQTLGQAVPGTGIEGLERVPVPRSRRRGTDG